MVRLADELDAPSSKYPYQWDALAVSSLTAATLAQIKGGTPFFVVTPAYLIKLGWATTTHNLEFEKNS
jgi:hypothetical protein